MTFDNLLFECDDMELDALRRERDEMWRDYDANIEPGICQTCAVFDRLDKQTCDYCGGRLATLEE